MALSPIRNCAMMTVQISLCLLLLVVVCRGDVPVPVVVSTIFNSTISVMDIAEDGQGTFLYSAALTNSIHRVDSDGDVMLLAGTGNATFGFNNGVGSAALFYYPTAITCDTALRMAYICDSNNQLIRTLNLSDNNVSTLAGSGQTATIDGVGTLAQFAFPGGIVFYRPDHHLDMHNNNNTVLYIAQYSGNAYIRKIDIDTANVTTVASLGGSLRSALRACITKDGAVLYVSMFGYSESSIARVDLRNGSNVTTLAGSSTGFADGASVHARFSAPQGIALNSDESVLIIADTKNYRIRQLRLLDNSVTTIAGIGVATTSQRDGIGLQATFTQPYGGKWHCFAAASRPSEKEVCGFLVADTNLVRFVAIEAARPSASLSSSVSTLSAAKILPRPHKHKQPPSSKMIATAQPVSVPSYFCRSPRSPPIKSCVYYPTRVAVVLCCFRQRLPHRPLRILLPIHRLL
ncbi:Hypothetical protein, putative [Bodo saltans]|uniref:Membrane-associated protein n=1 Tax=Bodo saltans TaxID=75058 RepID=A0A0S4JPN2_BODSA|nr:Hypothetical protein, putative [Bodo saltans]|eukprot:CUG90457.1 Hypothetical protein, putative [Bodo saltans]